MSPDPAQIMESLIRMYPVPEASKMLLYTHLRLAHSFANHQTRLKCVQARLHAISVLGRWWKPKKHGCTVSLSDNVALRLHCVLVLLRWISQLVCSHVFGRLGNAVI